MEEFGSDRELIADRIVYFKGLEGPVREEIRGLIKRYSDLMPACERLIVTWSPLPAALTGDKLFFTKEFDRGPKPFTGLYLTELWRASNPQQRRYEVAMGLQFAHWEDAGVVSLDDAGLRLDLEGTTLTGQKAADHLNRVARKLMARR